MHLVGIIYIEGIYFKLHTCMCYLPLFMNLNLFTLYWHFKSEKLPRHIDVLYKVIPTLDL